MTPLNLAHLEAFLAVVRTGGVRRAALRHAHNASALAA